MSKGISLYLAVVIMAIFLAIVLGISVILIGQVKMIKGMENSVIAFYAADTGVERTLGLLIASEAGSSSGYCSGSADSCDSLDNYSSDCEYQSGCTWQGCEPGPKGSSKCDDCDEMGQDACLYGTCSEYGCLWLGCEGEATPCNVFSNQVSCENQNGCTWNPEEEGSLPASYSSGAGEFNNGASYQINIVCCSSSDENCNFYNPQSGECVVGGVEDCPSSLTEFSDCLAPRYCLRSQGIFKGTKRALEISYGQVRPIGTIEEDIIYEPTSSSSFVSFYGSQWLAQTFTPASTASIYSVALRLNRAGNPGEIAVSIRATDGSGHPAGSDLCSGTTNGNTLPTSGSEWREIFLSGPNCQLSGGAKYAIVVRALSGSYNHYVQWRARTPGTYSGGNFEISYNSGDTWSSSQNRDFNFRTWICLP